MIKHRNEIEWCKNKELAIFFSMEPVVIEREPAHAMKKKRKEREKELASIKRYPFRNLMPFECVVFDLVNFKKYIFVVPKQNYDGASIPGFLWWLVGTPTDPFFKIPSLIHDTLCNNHKLINYDRELSTKIFKALLVREGVSQNKADLMCFFVDLWQKYGVGW